LSLSFYLRDCMCSPSVTLLISVLSRFCPVTVLLPESFSKRLLLRRRRCGLSRNHRFLFFCYISPLRHIFPALHSKYQQELGSDSRITYIVFSYENPEQTTLGGYFMKRSLVFPLIVSFILILASTALADPITVSGELDYRLSCGNDLAANQGTYTFNQVLATINFSAKIDDNTTIFVRLSGSEPTTIPGR